MKIGHYIQRMKGLCKKCFYVSRYGSRLKINGIPNLHKDAKITVEKKGRVCIGKGFSAQNNVLLKNVGGNLTIGSGVFLNRNCMLVCHNKISIEKNCIFGPGVYVYDHDHEYNSTNIVKGKYKTGEVVIGEGCWIAANVVILRNTHIGEGCVIGAGAVVKGDIPPHSLVTADRTLIVRPIVDKSDACAGNANE